MRLAERSRVVMTPQLYACLWKQQLWPSKLALHFEFHSPHLPPRVHGRQRDGRAVLMVQAPHLVDWGTTTETVLPSWVIVFFTVDVHWVSGRPVVLLILQYWRPLLNSFEFLYSFSRAFGHDGQTASENWVHFWNWYSPAMHLEHFWWTASLVCFGLHGKTVQKPRGRGVHLRHLVSVPMDIGISLLATFGLPALYSILHFFTSLVSLPLTIFLHIHSLCGWPGRHACEMYSPRLHWRHFLHLALQRPSLPMRPWPFFLPPEHVLVAKDATLPANSGCFSLMQPVHSLHTVFFASVWTDFAGSAAMPSLRGDSHVSLQYWKPSRQVVHGEHLESFTLPAPRLMVTPLPPTLHFLVRYERTFWDLSFLLQTLALTLPALVQPYSVVHCVHFAHTVSRSLLLVCWVLS